MAVSVRDVADDAGVSVGTVSNVLNRPGKVAPATVARVRASIERLGFVRNDAARQLRAGRSRAIGLVVLDVRNPFFTEMARGAEERAAEHGLTVLMAGSDDKPEREAAHLDFFEQQRVFGVLVTPLAAGMPRLVRMRDRGIPTVLVDRETHDASFASVAVDDVEGDAWPPSISSRSAARGSPSSAVPSRSVRLPTASPARRRRRPPPESRLSISVPMGSRPRRAVSRADGSWTDDPWTDRMPCSPRTTFSRSECCRPS